MIPQYCFAHPYCALFVASLSRSHSARTVTTWRFLHETKLAREMKGHFLLNEHGDLSFFLPNFDEINIFFVLNEFLKNSLSEKMLLRKTCPKSVFVGAKL